MPSPKPITVRTCADCGADISHRHGNALRCVECANAHTRNVRGAKRRNREANDPGYREAEARRHRAWYVRTRAVPRFCACGTDISFRGNRAVRCAPCSRVKWRESGNEARRIRRNNPQYRARELTELKRRWHDEDNAEVRQRKIRHHIEWKRQRRAENTDFRERENRQARERDRERRATDPEYRLLRNLRARTAQHERRWDATVTPESVADRLEKQRGKCLVCRKDIRIGYHLDHVIPLAKGGPSTLSNLQLLCPHCNVTKHAKDPVDFMQERGFLL